MALIYFYDCTDTDKQQLGKALASTDHRWEFIDSHISLDNLNPDAEVVSIFVGSTLSREMIERLPRLRLIACRSTGFNMVDLSAAKERDITVVNVPVYGERTVAEYAIGMLLTLTRQLREAAAAVLHPTRQNQLTGIDLFGKTLGVIGTGHIGTTVIEIAKGFGMNVVGYDAFPKPELAEKYGFEYRSLTELLACSDIVTLHTPYLPSTHHILNAEAFACLKKGAIVINTARGELIDTAALLAALENGTVSAAGLDVVEGEHLLNLDHELAAVLGDGKQSASVVESAELMALMRMPQVLMTTHNAFNTIEAIERINNTTVDNIVRFWFGDVPNKVKEQKPPMGKLIIARHGESEWNKTGRWTGTRDVHLTEKGFHEAALQGGLLRDITIHQGFISTQVRTLETIQGMIGVMQQIDIPIERSSAIAERDYGDYTGKNKADMRAQVGEVMFHKIRRDWDCPVPNGESLKQVYERAIPYYLDTILPHLKAGKNVLLVSHGNAIRALLKYIETISDEDISTTEMIFGTILIFTVDDQGKMVKKETRKISEAVTPAIQ